MEPSQPSKPVRRPIQFSLTTGILVAILIVMVSFVAGTRSDELLAHFSNKTSPTQLDFSSLNQLYSTLRAKYDGNVDASKLLDGAKHGLVSAVGDPYTVYLNADEAKAFDSDLNGTFEGIGAELALVGGKLTVMSVIGDSPAYKAGIKANDVIVMINGVSTTNTTVADAVTKIRGAKGTTVKLTVATGTSAPRDLSITRDTITDPSVKTEVTSDNYGIIRISRFGDDTADLAKKAADDLKSKSVKGVILDLRGNGGGLLTAAQSVASLWLVNKTIVTERTDGKITDTLSSTGESPLAGMSTVVLVDGDSASASEIVAGALSDNKAATLVGVKTFGKGSVQTILKLDDGGELKVTIAKWYTPNGKNINKEGITPDTVVTMSADDVNAGKDPQKDKALQLLQQGL